MRQTTTSFSQAFKSSNFANVTQKIAGISEMNEAFQKEFARTAPLSRIANVRNGVLAIEVPSGAVHAKVKFDLINIHNWAKMIDASIEKVEISVNPALYKAD